MKSTFVSTWILIDDAKRLGSEGDKLAGTLAGNWEFPLDIMFLSPEGKLITKLNSFRDLKAAHTDVGHPPEGRGKSKSHLDVFNGVLDKHFSTE